MNQVASRLYRRYRQTAESYADASAMTFISDAGRTARTYTYAELFDRAEALGTQLRGLGLGRSAPLGVLLSSQEEQVLHYLAALDAGTVPALLTPPNRKLNRAYYQETMTAVLRRCGFEAVVLGIEGVQVPSRALAPTTFEPLETSRDDEGSQATVPGPQLDASFMQFSSGTTGIKRGVLVSDDAVLNQLETYAEALELHDSDQILSWLPLYHDMGFVACLNMPLAYGVHSIMIDPIDWVTNPLIYLQAVGHYRATLSWHPNFAFAFMAQRIRDRDLDGLDLSSLRGLVNCSEPVTHESQQAFLDRYRDCGLADDVFMGCYAMAETTFALTHGTCRDDGYHDPVGPRDGTRKPPTTGHVAVGRPLPAVELRVVHPDEHRDLPDGTVGELWVRSPFNFSGYYNDDEASDRAFVGDWYRTGDLGYRRGDTYYIAGRLKDVLIVGGVNVFPQDIEEMVSSFEGIQPGRVSAFSRFDERVQTERIVILAESTSRDPVERRVLSQEVRQHLLAAFQIANFELHLVEGGWLVKSTSGKMARIANRSKWLDQHAELAGPASPDVADPLDST